MVVYTVNVLGEGCRTAVLCLTLQDLSLDRTLWCSLSTTSFLREPHDPWQGQKACSLERVNPDVKLPHSSSMAKLPRLRWFILAAREV
jgi:hypothetical protein